MSFNLDWQEFKEVFDSRPAMTMHYITLSNKYKIVAFDGMFNISTVLDISDPANADQLDFEANYKDESNKSMSQFDVDGAALVRTKAAQKGWTYSAVSFEFSTSTLDPIYSKFSDGTDNPAFSVRYYDSNGQVTTPGLANINLLSINRLEIDYEPEFDYEVIGGVMRTETSVSSDMRIWIVAVPDIPANLGGTKEMASGINLKFLSPENYYSVDGRVSKLLKYDPILHTNKLRFIIKHNPGVVENFSINLEIYKQ